MQVTLTVHRPGTEPLDVRITAHRPVTVPELTTLLACSPRDAARPLFGDGALLPARARLGDPGLRNGCLLTLGGSADRVPAAQSVLWLKVTAGPDCGRVIPLYRGRHVVGRGEESDVTLEDPNLSRRHVCLWVDAHSVEIQDLGSTNGTLLDGEPLDGARRVVPLPGTVSIGATRLEVAAIAEPPAAVTADTTGVLLVHRPPRPAELLRAGVLSMPEAPAVSRRPRIQWLAALLPIAISAVLAATLRSVQLLAFVALSPVTVLAGTMAERRSWRRKRHDQLAEYHRTRQAAEQTLGRSLRDELMDRRHTFPDAASVLLSATTHDCRLWERRPDQACFLALRLGLADQPARTTVNRNGVAGSAGTVPMVPAAVALTERTLGVAGPDRCVDGLCSWLVGQAVVLHSPADLSVVLLTDQLRGPGWRWLRWLPAGVLSVAASAEHRRLLAEQLQELVRGRRQRRDAAGHGWSGHWTLVVIDPAGLVSELPGLTELIDAGPTVGLAVICVARGNRSLPAGCSATMRFTGDDGTEAIFVEAGRPRLSVLADRVRSGWAERVGRSLACLRDAGDVRSAAGVDRVVRLTELLGLPQVAADAVRQRWRNRPAGPVAAIGAGGTGNFRIDLVADGPHLLIAGTTGSGKSELLKVLITSLAVQQPPTDLTFLLIDYKGGAAFAECAELPHVTRLVTDLDPQLTQRALASLNAELRRRERAFAQAGCAEFGDYQGSGHAAEVPLARLVLVIDEFASLAEELPELLAGLLGIAQRGRSLGVHLILATQRPAGVLSADIKANIGLRIALRTTDSADSMDVIGTEAASRIDRGAPGRAIARSADGRLEEFQTACLSQPAQAEQALLITELDEWNRAGEPPDPGRPTELAVLKQAIVAAAGDLPRPTPPWLEALPAVLSVEPSPGRTEVVFGRSDEPARQRQSPVSLDLLHGGALAFIGGPRSGRSTALRTIIGTAVSQLSAEQLHVYAIDCAGTALRPLRNLPHCGAVLDTSEPAAVARLIVRLVAERRRRQRQLAELGAADYAEGVAVGSSLPAILVALDGWSGLADLSEEMDAGRSAELFAQLLRDGASAGFSFLVTGDRSTLCARIAAALGRKLLLPLADRSDYALAGLNSTAVPRRPIPGRAVTAEDGIELQIGLLADDASSAAQWRALGSRALTMPAAVPGAGSRSAGGSSTPAGPRIRMRSLPTTVEASTLLERHGRASANGGCLLGIGGDDASAVECALFGPASRFLVAGPHGSGRTTVAILIAHQALARGSRLFVAAPARSPLSAWAAENGVATSTPAGSPAGIDPDLLVVDDAEHFTDTLVGDQLQAWIARADAAVVVTAHTPDLLNTFRGLGAELRRHRCGLLLQPAAPDGEILGVRLPQLPPSDLPGRGVLVSAETRTGIGGYQPIQVAK
jgi:DNA segregation ATPase FtsK/SpoIIIE, S-DNA-T family